jgi:hypothetical protein
MSAAHATQAMMRIHLRAPSDALAGTLEAIVGLLNESSLSGIVSPSRPGGNDIDLPLRLEVIDDERKLRALVPFLESMVGDGLITFERRIAKRAP